MNDINQINDLLVDDVKRHYAKRDQAQIVNLGMVSDIRKSEANNKEENNEKKSLGERIVNSLCIRIGLLLIIFAVIYVYPNFPDSIKASKAISWIKSEYNNNYSKEYIIEKGEEYSKSLYNKYQKYIPDSLYVNVVDKYIHIVKPVLIGSRNSIKIDNSVTVFNDESIELDINPEDFVLAQSVTTSSEISQMDLDVSAILSKNISITCPVNGTVTSVYGAREEVFKNVGYHTGVDIANSLNTPVSSATSGKVVKTQSMDKYYGNNIEIENNGVIFKYAHLNQINVSEGDSVNQGDVIGLMGSTGASTGSHLHFEIRINGRSVDPELLVKVR